MMANCKDKIFQLDARVIRHEEFAAGQHVLSLKAEKIANTAKAGSFVHIQCGDKKNLRRPISIMQVDKDNGTIDLLFKVVGSGTECLAGAKVDDSLNLLGPIGKAFTLDSKRPSGLLIGGGVGMPPMVFLAKSLKAQGQNPMVIFGSEVPFPFASVKSNIKISNLPNAIDTSISLLEDLSIATRCASLQDYSGVYKGYVTDLARLWLDGLNKKELAKVMVYSCGPHAMLEAVHRLAQEYELPCQVSLEEYMACGVGGCAGCVVRVREQNTFAMKRVCVDGPVFFSNKVFGF